MKLAREKFERILERYLTAARKISPAGDDVIKIRYAESFKRAIEFLEANTSEDILNLEAVGSADTTTFNQQKDKFDALTHFFNEALKEPSTGTEAVTFDEDRAPTLKSVLLDPFLRTTDTLLLHTAPTNLGIREKYTRGLLTQQHWLTDLDLQRMVKLTGNQSDIHILPFEDHLSVGTALHFARKAHEESSHSSESYTVSLLLNLGSSSTGGQGTHWIAATVTINPRANTVSYQIDDSMTVSVHDSARYKSIMEEAVRYDDGFHCAFPLAATVSGTVKGHATQSDGYSCGYRALHHLLQDSRLQKNEEARAYAAVTSPRSEDLVNTFYRLQLTDLALTPTEYASLDDRNQRKFARPLSSSAKVSVAPDMLDAFLSAPPAKATATSPEKTTPLDPAITDLISGYNPGQILPVFFPKSTEKKFSDVDYYSLCESLSRLPAPIADFRLTHCSIDALAGLNAFYNDAPETPTLFNTLTLNISAEEAEIDTFMTKLLLTLKHLSNTNLSRLIINDDKGLLKEAQIKAIIKTVSTRSDSPLSFTIDLPQALQNTEYQRELDMAIAGNIRLKSSKALEGKRTAPKASKSKDAPIRQREKIADLRAAMKTDVEMQQGVEATVDIQLDTTKVVSRSITNASELTILRPDLLSHAERTNDFSTLATEAGSLSKQNFAAYWHRLFNDIVLPAGLGVIAGQQLKGITDQALKQLIKYREYFQDGINLQFLPQGFTIVVDPINPEGRILHYDPTLENSDALAPQPLTRAERPILGIDLIDELMKGQDADKAYVKLWNELKKPGTYPRDNIRLFRQYLPELMLLSADQLKSVVELCGGTDSFDFKKLAFIFTHLEDAKAAYNEPYSDDHLISKAWIHAVFPNAPDREKYIRLAHTIIPVAATTHPLLNLLEKDNPALKAKVASAITAYGLKDMQVHGLLAIYDKYGSIGIEKLLAAWDELKGIPNITPELIRSVYLNPTHYEALLLTPTKINDAAKKISGFTSEQRQWWQKLYEAHRPINDDLPALVESFKQFSEMLSSRSLPFYSLTGTGLFPGAGNLPTTLGRIISILDRCPEVDRAAQWEAISQIDLSTEGALRAMTEGIGGKQYSFVFPEMKINAQRNNPDTAEGLELTGILYDFLATQEYRLPVKFYREMFKYINESLGEGNDESIPRDLNYTLFELLVNSTTGDHYRYFAMDAEEAKKQWKNTIDNIKTLVSPLPALLATSVLKQTIISQLNSKAADSIKLLAPLAILAKLIPALTQPLKTTTLFNASSIKSRLKKNKDDLNALLKKYGLKVYQGMAFYDPAAFETAPTSGNGLFEDYLAIASKMDGAKIADFLLPFVSTFGITLAHVEALTSTIPEETLEALKAATPLSQFDKEMWEYALNMLADLKSNTGLNPEILIAFLQDFTQILETQKQETRQEWNALEARLRSPDYIPHEDDAEKITRLQPILHMMKYSELVLTVDKALPELKGTVLSLIERKFKPNFPKDYFENLRAGKAKPDIQLLIDQSFKAATEKKIVEQIQKRYGAVTDKQFTDLIDLLATLTRRLSDTDERVKLLERLASERLTSAPIADYINLLESIKKQDSSSFTYFMNTAERFPTVTELATKTTYFLSIALPKIRERKSPAYSEIEIIDLVADLVLAGKDKELAEEIDIHSELTVAFAALKDAIVAAKLDAAISTSLSGVGELPTTTTEMPSIPAIEKIRRALGQLKTLNPEAADLPAIKALERHLNDLTTLAKERYTIPAVTEEREVPLPGAVEEDPAPPAAAEPPTHRRAPRGIMGSLTQSLTSSIASGFASLVSSLSAPKAPSPAAAAPRTKRETFVVSPAREETRFKVKTLDMSALDAAEKILTTRAQETKSYTYAFTQTLALLENLIQKYPGAKTQLLSLGRHYLSSSTSTEKQVKQAFMNLRAIHNELIALDNQDLVLSLCEHFGAEKSAKSAFKLDQLLAIFQGQTITDTSGTSLDFTNYPPLPPATKKQLLHVIAALLNNDKPCSLQDIENLIKALTINPDYATMLQRLFENAPYPTLDRIDSWINDASNRRITGAQLIEDIFTKYIEWNKKPVEREDSNGFHLDEALRQAKVEGVSYTEEELERKMKGVSYTRDDLEHLDREVKRVRDLTTQQLLDEIKLIKTPEGKNAAQLVALIAELLYRTKGLPGAVDGAGKRIDGRSFEINTTQYLAIHSMLKSGGHVTSQIGTGEGKSRIMMIAIACQYALGNTVDFVTSDLSLARRDYLEYQAFFKVLGAETRLIYAQTAAKEYQVGGINFSDAANLALFRNKARSEGDEALVLAKDATTRSLMLDEADKTYFDTSDTRFNYSAQTDATIRDMPWIYELLIEFFSDKKNEALYHGPESNADQCNEAFYNFARSKLSDKQFARLVYNPEIPGPVVSRNQLEAWQSSALTALVLEEGRDYIIVPDLTVQTKKGPTPTSQAQLLSGGRVTGSAKFSFGVHQCLHARLNLLRAQGRQADAEPFAKRLASLKADFYVDSENQIVYSSTSKSLLDDYQAGNLLAVTGTAGAIQEQEEASVLFGHSESKMTFIEVPRHRGQQRKDLPWQFAKDTNTQRQQILESVRESIRRNQPVLLICENDTASKELHAFLEKALTTEEKDRLMAEEKTRLAALKTTPTPGEEKDLIATMEKKSSATVTEKLTRISASTSLEDEATHVAKKAGKPGMITISTVMLGRGTDIALHDEAKHVGLSVIGTYLPRERDYRQVIGRAGRFGAPGQSRLILDSEKLKTQLGTQVLPTELYTATEAYLELQQRRMDHAAQQQRVIKNAVGDFRIALTNRFFKEFYKPLLDLKKENKDPLLASWQRFFDKADKEWNDIWPKIVAKLAEPAVKIAEIETLLNDYKNKVQSEWKIMREEIAAAMDNGIIYHPSGKLFLNTHLDEEVGRVTLSEVAIRFLQPQAEHALLRTPRADHYDPAYVGRAVIYTNFLDRVKSFFENIKAARRGDAPWFPNLQAARHGNMSWSEFFFGKWGSPPVAKQATAKPAVPGISLTDTVKAPSGPETPSDRVVQKALRADATATRSDSKQGASVKSRGSSMRSEPMRKRYGGTAPPARPSPSSKGAEPPTSPVSGQGTADYRKRRLGGRPRTAPAPRSPKSGPTSGGDGG